MVWRVDREKKTRERERESGWTVESAIAVVSVGVRV